MGTVMSSVNGISCFCWGHADTTLGNSIHSHDNPILSSGCDQCTHTANTSVTSANMEAVKSRFKQQVEITLSTTSDDVCAIASEREILCGKISDSEISASSRVVLFISSTFEDTKFEQDYLLLEVFPFLEDFCRQLHLSFSVVTMRWGVRAAAGNFHLTSEMCMQQLEMCKQESVGLAYVTLQSHRYGYRPFPNTILADEFEKIMRNVSGELQQYLDPPYWKQVSHVCILTTKFLT